MVAVTLHMGNIEIDESNYQDSQTPCTIVKNKSWKAVIDLLEINEQLFEESLTHK